MNFRLLACVLITALLGVTLGCGRPSAKNPESRKISRPENRNLLDQFFLADGAFDKTYKGALIYWKEEAEAKQIGLVKKLSDERVALGVKTLKTIEENIVPLAAEFRAKRDATMAASAQFQTSYKTTLTAAAVWFPGVSGQVEGQLEKVSKQLSTPLVEAEVGGAKKYFALYCSAKLWERTIDAKLIGNNYKRRPSPLALCEGFYRSANIMSEEEAVCGPASGAAGKNYFACMWEYGVKRTPLFASLFPEGSSAATKINEITADKWQAYFATPGQPTRAADFLSLKPVQMEGDVGVDLTPAVPLPPLSILLTMEAPSDKMGFFTGITNRPEADLAVLKTEEQRLKTSFAALGRQGEDGYANEAIFNQPLLVGTPSLVAKPEVLQAAQGLFGKEVFLSASPTMFEALGGTLKLASELKALAGRGKDELEKVGVCKREVDPQSLKCQEEDLIRASGEALYPENVAHANLLLQIRLFKSADGAFLNAEVVVNAIPGASKLTACMPLRDDATCAKGFDGELSIDPEVASVDLKFELKDVSSLGLHMSERAFTGPFNLIPARDYKGKTLEIKSYLSRVDGMLDMIVGSSKITGDEANYLGSVKLTDQAPAMRLAAAAFQADLEALQKASK